ncbi:MAG TPA: hypothetical protein VEL73_05510, partial [Mycobacteriales bacterium]|nr:hypothetical protein [Mycobacteriales bacterium]
MNASDPRMAAAHRLLVDSVRRLATSTDWRTVLDLARQLPQYSPNNCLLLAAQGAHGMVMGYRAWQRIPAAGGGRCQVRRGAKSLAVLAPITRTPSEPDPAGGDGTAVRRVVGYRRAAVFDQRALIAPPAVPDVTPRPLTAAAPEQLRPAVDGLITAAGYRLLPAEQATRIAPSNGLTDFAARTVALRADLPAAQQLKTAVHELAHIRLHTPHPAAEPMERGRAEVEAESVAYLVTAELGLDASAHTLPYLTGWSGGDPDLVLATAQRVITAARGIADDLTLQLRTPAPPAPPPPVDPPPPAGEGLVLADTMPTAEPAGSPTPGAHVVLGSRSGWWQIGWDPTHTTFHAQHHPTRTAGPAHPPARSVRIGGAPAAVPTVGALEERLGFALPGTARAHLDADRRTRPG